MHYTNKLPTPDAEVAPRSPHHASMLVLEQRVSELRSRLDDLVRKLEPAMHRSAPDAAGNDAPPTASDVEMIVHTEAICEQVDGCVAVVADCLNRLAI